LSTKGINYGDFDVKGSSLVFTVEKKKVFEIPLSDVNRVVNHTGISKNDVSIEFNEDNTNDNNELAEIRFFVPNSETDEGKTTAQRFHKKLFAKADIASTTGKGIVTIPQMPFLNPRGRYNLEFFPTFFKMYGKTYEFKIKYNQITRLFQLARPDKQIFVVFALDPPIKQSQIRHHHMVLIFQGDEKLEPQKLTFASETGLEALKEKYPEGEISGSTSELISDLLKIFTGKKVTHATHSFKSASDFSAVRCTLKTNDGYLYPLEKKFFVSSKTNNSSSI